MDLVTQKPEPTSIKAEDETQVISPKPSPQQHLGAHRFVPTFWTSLGHHYVVFVQICRSVTVTFYKYVQPLQVASRDIERDDWYIIGTSTSWRNGLIVTMLFILNLWSLTRGSAKSCAWGRTTIPCTNKLLLSCMKKTFECKSKKQRLNLNKIESAKDSVNNYSNR